MKRPLPHTAKSKQTSSDGAQTRSAEVISLRPRGGNSEARKQNKPSPQKGTLDLPLEEICEGWGRVTKRNPDILKAAIFAAFWRGLFETGEVPEIFQWVKPDDPEGGPSYLNSTNGVYEVAKDGSRHFTARREKLTWSRRDLYRDRVCGKEGSDDEITALAFRPLNSYPPDFLNIWLPILHMAREDFARWYAEAPLSAGAPLDSFWPGPTSAVARTAEVNLNSEPKWPDEAVDAPLLHSPKTGTPKHRKRGRKPVKLQNAVEALGQLDRKLLKDISDKELESRFGDIAKRTWLNKARDIVLSQPERISDK